MKSGKHLVTFLIVVLLLLALPNVISLLRGPAATPDVFSAAYTLEQANQLSIEQGKPVFVLATADWCAPCQALKRGAMVDPGVVELINQRTIPVYLEESQSIDDIRSLGVRAYPTTLIVQQGEVIARIEGGASPDRFAEMLRSELPPAP
ncbi:MAG: thioredoxin family protein [Phycisphaerales bacterium]